MFNGNKTTSMRPAPISWKQKSTSSVHSYVFILTSWSIFALVIRKHCCQKCMVYLPCSDTTSGKKTLLCDCQINMLYAYPFVKMLRFVHLSSAVCFCSLNQVLKLLNIWSNMCYLLDHSKFCWETMAVTIIKYGFLWII